MLVNVCKELQNAISTVLGTVLGKDTARFYMMCLTSCHDVILFYAYRLG